MNMPVRKGEALSIASPAAAAEVLRLNQGRFRVAASSAGAAITVRVRDATAIAGTGAILVRTSTSGAIALVRDDGSRPAASAAIDGP